MLRFRSRMGISEEVRWKRPNYELSSALLGKVLFLTVLSFNCMVFAGNEAENMSGGDILNCVNLRPLGITEYRLAKLRLMLGDILQHEYKVETFRKRTSRKSVTLFVLRAPDALRGTAFLLRESFPPRVSSIETWLFLPSGDRRTLRIDPTRLSESLLGSDFTYQDWRIWIPFEDLVVRVLPEKNIDGKACYVLLAIPRSRSDGLMLGWVAAKFYVSKTHCLITRADYYSSQGGTIDRIYHARNFRLIDGVWTPNQMIMTNRNSKESSIVQLEKAWHNRQLPDEIFVPEMMPDLLSLLDKLGAQGYTGLTGVGPR